MASVVQIEHQLIAGYIIISSIVLYLYEWMITISAEADVIWRRKWAAITCLYALTRYSSVLDQILLLITPWNFISCAVIGRIANTLQLLQFLCFAWFSALRVYALLNGAYLVSGIVFLLNLVPFATNLFNLITTAVVEDFESCVEIPAGSNNLHLSLSLATRSAVIIGDVLVLAVTWTKTAQAYLEARRLQIKAPLATMLLRDGTVYFIILLLVNVLDILQQNIAVLFSMEIAAPFLQILLPIVVCRFILHLRQIEPAGSSWVSGNQSHSLRFVGNMGHSLRIGGEDESEDAENQQVTEIEENAAQVQVIAAVVIEETDNFQDKRELHSSHGEEVQQSSTSDNYTRPAYVDV